MVPVGLTAMPSRFQFAASRRNRRIVQLLAPSSPHHRVRFRLHDSRRRPNTSKSLSSSTALRQAAATKRTMQLAKSKWFLIHTNPTLCVLHMHTSLCICRYDLTSSPLLAFAHTTLEYLEHRLKLCAIAHNRPLVGRFTSFTSATKVMNMHMHLRSLLVRHSEASATC